MLTQEEKEVGAEQADELWEKFCRDFHANRCPRCEGHGRVGLYACNACGATGQRPPLSPADNSPH